MPLTQAQVEAIPSMLPKNCGGIDDFHFHPKLPPKKLKNARKTCNVAGSVPVSILVDATVFGSAKNGLLFGAGGVYIHNDWMSEQSGASTVALEDFLAGSSKKKDQHNVWVVDQDKYVDISGCGASAEQVVELLDGIRRAARQLIGSSVDDDEPEEAAYSE